MMEMVDGGCDWCDCFVENRDKEEKLRVWCLEKSHYLVLESETSP